MSTALHTAQLRTTAKNLRALSNTIGSCRALSVYGLAGPETWVGPTAQSCFDALLEIRRQLEAQQQSLGDAARMLERRADELAQQPVRLLGVS